MAEPESVAKGEQWVLAANESFIVDDVREWKQRQVDSEVRHHRRLLELKCHCAVCLARTSEPSIGCGQPERVLMQLPTLRCATVTQHNLQFARSRNT